MTKVLNDYLTRGMCCQSQNQSTGTVGHKQITTVSQAKLQSTETVQSNVVHCTAKKSTALFYKSQFFGHCFHSPFEEDKNPLHIHSHCLLMVNVMMMMM